MLERGRGYERGPLLAHEHPRFGAHPLVGGPAPLRGWADLEPLGPPTMDQYDTSSCYGHGSSFGLAVQIAVWRSLHAGASVDVRVPSPKGIYDAAREIVRARLPDGTLEPLSDDGVDPVASAPALGRSGIRELVPLPGRYSDCESATINRPETQDQDLASARTLPVGAHAIDPESGSFARNVCRLLDASVCTGVGIPSRGAFEAQGDSGALAGLALAGTGDRRAADHWVCACGYRTNPDGSIDVKLRNSWGAGWGLAGSLWVAETWFGSAVEQAIVYSVDFAAVRP